MPRKGVSSKHLQSVEDDIALMLSGRDAWAGVKLWIEGRIRRGYYSDLDEVREIQKDISRVDRAISRSLERAKEERNPGRMAA